MNATVWCQPVTGGTWLLMSMCVLGAGGVGVGGDEGTAEEWMGGRGEWGCRIHPDVCRSPGEIII